MIGISQSISPFCPVDTSPEPLGDTAADPSSHSALFCQDSVKPIITIINNACADYNYGLTITTQVHTLFVALTLCEYRLGVNGLIRVSFMLLYKVTVLLSDLLAPSISAEVELLEAFSLINAFFPFLFCFCFFVSVSFCNTQINIHKCHSLSSID